MAQSPEQAREARREQWRKADAKRRERIRSNPILLERERAANRERMRKYRAEHPEARKRERERQREYSRKYRATHREHVREYMREYQRQYQQAHPELKYKSAISLLERAGYTVSKGAAEE